MKIIIASLSYKPNISGVAIAVASLVEHLSSHGHQVTLIIPARELRTTVTFEGSVKVWRIRSIPNPARRGFFIPVFTKKLMNRICLEAQPDLVHVHDPMAMSRYLCAAATKRGVPTVVSNHFLLDYIISYVPKFIRPLLRRDLRRWIVRFYNSCDRIIVPSRTVAARLTALGVRQPITPLSNGVDLDRFYANFSAEQTKSQFSIPRRPVILYTGRLDKDKSIDVLLGGFLSVIARTTAQLVLVGSGSRERYIKGMIRSYQLEKFVSVVGAVPHDSIELVALYQAADVFVMPSSIETQGISVLEAMAAAKPVVAANGGAVPELLIDGKNGLLFKPGDQQELARKVVSLLEDPKLRQRLSEEALKTVVRHGLEKSLTLFERLYENLVEN